MATGGLAFASASELPTRPAAPEDEDAFDRDFYSLDVCCCLYINLCGWEGDLRESERERGGGERGALGTYSWAHWES
jgi:hypothetical protein